MRVFGKLVFGLIASNPKPAAAEMRRDEHDLHQRPGEDADGGPAAESSWRIEGCFRWFKGAVGRFVGSPCQVFAYPASCRAHFQLGVGDSSVC